MATPTLTAQNGNIMTGTLPANASGFNAQGDIIYNTAPKAPVGSAVVTSQPAAEAYKNSAAWMANEQNQAAVRASNAALAKQTAAANTAASQTQNTKTQVATNALEGFVRTSNNTEKLSAGDQARVDEITRINGQLGELATQMDSRAASQVQSVIDQYAGLARRQEVANASYEGGVSTAGLSSGRNRYAPEIQAGVQSAAVASGIQALSDLQVKKQSLINEIEQARDTQKFKVLTEKVQQLKTLQKDERDAARQMKQDFYDEQKYMRENSIFQSERNAAYVASQLTGDPATDQKIYEDSATTLGISQSILVNAVDKYKQDAAKLYETPDVKEFNFAISRGDIPKNANFESWVVKRANDKVKASGGTGNDKADKEAQDVFKVYSSNILNDLKSQSPDSVVRNIALESKANGNSLSPATLAALLNYVNSVAEGGSDSPSADTQVSLPGETSYGLNSGFISGNPTMGGGSSAYDQIEAYKKEQSAPKFDFKI